MVQSICMPKLSPLSGPGSKILADVMFVTDVFIANSYLIGDSSGSSSRNAYLVMMNLLDSLRIRVKARVTLVLIPLDPALTNSSVVICFNSSLVSYSSLDRRTDAHTH